MTILLRWLLIPILILIALLFWKGSPLLIKSALLLIPLAIIIGWFAQEGAFGRGGGLEKLYGSVTLIIFLFCYEIGMLFHRYSLAKKNSNTIEDDILLIIGLVILTISIIFFLITLSR